MVRRTDRPLLQVRVSFEATRSAPHHLIEAYARLVPMVQLALAHRLAVWVSSAAWCPYVEPETTIRLVWGFPCQGCITPLFVVLLLHSFVRPAPRAFFRRDRILPSPSRAAMVKDGAFSVPPKACP